MNRFTILFSTLIFFLALTFFSQSTYGQSKHHFLLKQNGQVIEHAHYYSEINQVHLDEFRFMTIRRVLPIEGTDITVELLSAQELLDVYQKPLSPLTKSDNQDSRQVKFVSQPNGGIKLIVIQ